MLIGTRVYADRSPSEGYNAQLYAMLIGVGVKKKEWGYADRSRASREE